MSTKFFPEALFERGFTDLVSVIPPNGELAPSSRIDPSQRGKVPGRRNVNGTWGGYDWRKHQASIDDVRQWCIEGANIGLRATRYPGIDIDTLDENLARTVEEFTVAKLGPAPVRIGRAPKRLLMYRTDEPFGRMRLRLYSEGVVHLIEVLGSGQQYLVYGTHPTTHKPYAWTPPEIVGFEGLTSVTREQVGAFLDELAGVLEVFGSVEHEGNGKLVTARADIAQAELLAPSLDALREAVALIPNDQQFDDRNVWIAELVAIKAAGGSAEAEAMEIAREWSERWTRGARAGEFERTWDSLRPPFSVGWDLLAQQARRYGFNDAALEFDVTQEEPATKEEVASPHLSDHWLADRVAERIRDTVRFSPQKNSWLVWNAARWQVDAELRAEETIKRALRAVADEILRQGATDKEKKENAATAIMICSAYKLAAVMTLVKSDSSINVSISTLDHDPWVLNTPQGIIDLKTGQVSPSDPDALCTKITTVPADFTGTCPEWKRFLAEATGDDAELQGYLQRLAGYALTGSTEEQHLTFIWGDGGNGKGTFLDTLVEIMGDGEYQRTAAMDTFTASYNEKHSTDVASFVGARLVTAEETEAGKRWDEARVKALTGGGRVTARFMRQDNFTFIPQFKLVFIGNHKPEIRSVDAAMKRRIQMVAFMRKPKVKDKKLREKLRLEYPAILAWIVQGCLAWQQEGLNPPPAVRAATEEYFSEEDAVGRWLGDCIVADSHSNATSSELFQSWTEWANANGEYRGTQKRLSSALAARGYARWKHPESRRAGFSGVRIEHRQDLEAIM